MKKTFRLQGLECANCAAKMEKDINELNGVKEATINFLTSKMVIEAEDEKMDDIIASAEKIIKKYEPGVIIKKV